VKVQGYTRRLAGHSLRHEGAYRGGERHVAECSCGKIVEVVSQGAAKRWHREHKQDIVDGKDPRA